MPATGVRGYVRHRFICRYGLGLSKVAQLRHVASQTLAIGRENSAAVPHLARGAYGPRTWREGLGRYARCFLKAKSGLSSDDGSGPEREHYHGKSRHQKQATARLRNFSQVSTNLPAGKIDGVDVDVGVSGLQAGDQRGGGRSSCPSFRRHKGRVLGSRGCQVDRRAAVVVSAARQRRK